MNKEELKEKINDLTLTYYVSKEAAINLIDQLDEPKIISQTQAVEFLAGEYNLTEDEVNKVLLNYRKPVVPSFVARWFEEHKSSLEFAIFSAVVDVYGEDETEYSKMEEWLNNEDNKPIETLVKMQDGYTVEEKKYQVRDKEGCILILKNEDGEVIKPRPIPLHPASSLNLTEQEIKDYDPRYMAFAEPVNP